MFAFLPTLDAILLILSNSDSDSTLKQRILFLIPKNISSSVFPTPENTIFDALPPALMLLSNSPQIFAAVHQNHWWLMD